MFSTSQSLNKTQLEQRLETLEAIVRRMEERLSGLEQDQNSSLPPSVQTLPPITCLQPLNSCLEASPPATVSTSKRVEISKDIQAVPALNEQLTIPVMPLSTLSTDAWHKGLTTNQLVARLKTNPTTLKKYLRDLKQMQ